LDYKPPDLHASNWTHIFWTCASFSIFMRILRKMHI
jgi:hypothetical protein